jgi:hypothetical protein
LVIAMDLGLTKAEREELQADLERRELELLEQPGGHQLLTRSAPQLVYKVTDNGSDYDNGGPPSPLNNDDLINGVAGAMAQMRESMMTEIDNTMLAPMRERIAAVEGKLDALLTMLGGADTSRAKSLRKRLQDDGHFLEAPRHSS